MVRTNGSGGLSASIVSRLLHNSEYTSCTQSRASSRLRSKLYASAYILPLNGKYICVNCSCVIGTCDYSCVLCGFYVFLVIILFQPSNHVPFATISKGFLYVIRFSRLNLTTELHFIATKSEPKPAFEEDFYVKCLNHSFVSLLSSFFPYFLYRRISTRNEQRRPMPMPRKSKKKNRRLA